MTNDSDNQLDNLGANIGKNTVMDLFKTVRLITNCIQSSVEGSKT
jgi:hypothetical protein